MGWVSEESFEEVAAGLIMTREKRREIQKMNRDDLQRYLIRLYKLGFEDGMDALQAMLEEKAEEAEGYTVPFEEITLDWEDVLSVIARVRGIGPRLLQKIDEKLKEEY